MAEQHNPLDSGIRPLVERFFDAKKKDPPDVKALANFLRGDKPLPEGFRLVLAEVLDSRFPGKLACNWQLTPMYVGRYDYELKVSAVDPAAHGRPTRAIRELAPEIGVCERRAWDSIEARP